MKKLIILLIFSFYIFFCSSQKISVSVYNENESWRTIGKDLSRNSYAETILKPPLKILWKKNLNAAAANGMIFSGNTLIVPVRNGRVHFVNHETGDFFKTIKTKSGLIGTPILHDNILIIPGTNGKNNLFFYSFEEEDFVLREKFPDIETSPALYGENVLIAAVDGVFYSINRYGKKNWNFNTGSKIYSTPAVSGKNVIVASAAGTVFCLDCEKGKVKWKFETKNNIFSSPIIFNDKVYFGNSNGDIYSISLDSGELIWQDNIAGELMASPVTDGKRIIFGSDTGFLFAYSIDGKLQWKKKLKTLMKISPVISGNYCYIGDMMGNLYAVQMNSGDIAWESNLGGRIKTALVIIDKKLYVSAEDNKLFCLEEEK
ncbi:PQQ-binding-like beta-propeller repeat protein [candidate division KSB1 bacterium]